VRWPYRHRGLRIIKTLLPRGLSDRVSPDLERSDRRSRDANAPDSGLLRIPPKVSALGDDPDDALPTA
jgi:hypothetical protein